MESIQQVFDYLKACGPFFLATMDGDQPRVRPFQAIAIFEDKFYILTKNFKQVFAQMQQNPKIEITATASDRSWMRLTATAIVDDRAKAREYMIEQNPQLKPRFAADDGTTEVLYLRYATATFCALGSEPKTVKF